MLRDGGSGPGELKFQRQPDNKFDANAIGVLLDGHNVGYLPKKLATFLAPAMDAHVVDVSLEMGSVRPLEAPSRWGRPKLAGKGARGATSSTSCMMPPLVGESWEGVDTLD